MLFFITNGDEIVASFLDILYGNIIFTVDQPQVKGPHVRFKKLVQIGKNRTIMDN